jgi:hypothetical protein
LTFPPRHTKLLTNPVVYYYVPPQNACGELTLEAEFERVAVKKLNSELNHELHGFFFAPNSPFNPNPKFNLTKINIYSRYS